MKASLAIVCIAFVASLTVSRAIVIVGGTGTENFTDPGGGLPWAHVGSVGGATGVYLGNYGGNHWVLTASHVVGSGSTLGNLVLDAGTFTFVPGSAVIVRNGDNSPTDLTLFRVFGDPGLANLQLSSSAPVASSAVILVGRGQMEGAANYWDVTVNPGATDDVWNNQGGTSAGANRAGYLWAANGDMRWGQNTVTGFSNFNIGTGDTAAFYTTFDNVAGDAQGATGDSGGATFYYNGSSWELAGIMGAIAGFENQPGSTAVIGNATYSASIADYNGFITSAIPEPSTYAAVAGLLALAAMMSRRRVTS
jgi:hypothetical protein